MTKKRIGILTGGGDVPGLNSVIKTVTYRSSGTTSKSSAFGAAGKHSPTWIVIIQPVGAATSCPWIAKTLARSIDCEWFSVPA